MKVITHISIAKVGETVVMSDVNRPARRVVIEKIGRKYIYVKGSRTPFSIRDGVAADDFQHHRLHTLTQWEEAETTGAALQQLRSWGVTLSSDIRSRAVQIRDALEALFPTTQPGAKS